MENETTKNNTKRNGIILSIIGGVLVLGGILGSYAFFQTVGGNNQKESLSVQAGNMELIFSDGNNGFETELEFGSSASKTFTITNNGSLDAVAKINWKNLVNTYLEESLSYSLTYIENEGDTPVEVIIDKNVPTSTVASTIELANGLSIPAGKTYTYTLTITLNYLESTDQTADLNARLSTEFSLEEGSPIVEEPVIETGKATQVLLSKKNDVSVENYEAANKGEMFTFEHDATEQTPALTDYRYIGKVPNNYISFNNETWRIIGVFTAEGENGEREQRIKIIRDASLGSMSWDMKSDKSYMNEWPSSTLSTMLNGDYVNTDGTFTYTWYGTSNGTANTTSIPGLTATAKSQISPAKWYLGGNSTTENLGGTDYYAFERGTIVYSGHNTNVVAKVGLMYPSDYVYTYSNGVDNICYQNGLYCDTSQGGTPSSGWLFNSNFQWTITPLSHSTRYAFIVHSSGYVNYSSGVFNLNISVRPCVYLRSDIEITGGDGSSENPYTLSVPTN